MKKIFILGLLLLFAGNVFAGAPSRPYIYISDTTIDPDENNANENTLYNYLSAGVDTYESGSVNAAAIGENAVGNSELNNTDSFTFSGTVNLTGTTQIDGTAITATAAELNYTDGSIDLTSEITGVLPTANGGTGATTAVNTANGVVVLDASGDLPNTCVPNAALDDNAVGNDEMADDAVHQAELYTTSGEVSTTASDAELVLPGGEYGFYPQFKHTQSLGAAIMFGNPNDADPWDTIDGGGTAGYITNIILGDKGSGTCYAQQRYIQSSSDTHWTFILWDNVTKEIVSAYSAPDHPCYGQGEQEDEIPHPFVNYFDEPLPSNLEVVLLDNSELDKIKKKMTRNKKVLEIINEDYTIDEASSPVYEPRDIVEIDEWGDRGGEVIKTYKNKTKYGKTKELKRRTIESLPGYIKYKKLKKK